MRTLLTTILLSLMLPLLAATPARAAGYRVEEIPNVQLTDRNRYVSNPDRILSEAAVARIDSLCGSWWPSTRLPATISSPSPSTSSAAGAWGAPATTTAWASCWSATGAKSAS